MVEVSCQIRGRRPPPVTTGGAAAGNVIRGLRAAFAIERNSPRGRIGSSDRLPDAGDRHANPGECRESATDPSPGLRAVRIPCWRRCRGSRGRRVGSGAMSLRVRLYPCECWPAPHDPVVLLHIVDELLSMRRRQLIRPVVWCCEKPGTCTSLLSTTSAAVSIPKEASATSSMAPTPWMFDRRI